MRESPGGWNLSTTGWLMVIFVAIFALDSIDSVYFRTGFWQYLALSSSDLFHGYVWELITFQFLHASLFHLVGNLVGFWWVGNYVESLMGGRRMLIAWLGFGTCGGIAETVVQAALPIYHGGGVVGASAGLAGLMAIFCLLNKDASILLMYVIPVRAIYFLYGFGAFCLFFIFVPAMPGIAHAAHLFGLLSGVFWVRQGWYHDYQPLPGQEWLERLRFRLQRQKPARSTQNSPSRTVVPFPTQPQPRPRDEFIAREVDPILEKIAAYGIQSLTAEERAVLQNARNKISGR